MFSKKTIAIIALTTASASRVKVEREPLLSWKPKAKKDPYPMDYKVPNFGIDQDVATTQASIAQQEKRRGKVWVAKLKKDVPKGHPVDYFVPNFGVDSDVKTTSASIDLAEGKLKHKWTPKLKKDVPKGHPVDYFVPNFGIDQDVASTIKNVKFAEQKYGQWNPVIKAPKGHPVDYPVPSFGVDADIKASLSNLNSAESKYGRWDLPKEDVQVEADIQTEADREPLLTWKPKEPKTHPMNYFVPNFGIDHDIAHSQAHEKAAETRLKHKWVPKKDKDDKWVLPSPEIEFKLIGLDTEAEREPLLTWKPKAPKTHPMDYFVPNFGIDQDVTSTLGSVSQAEGRYKRKWVPKLKKDVPKGHPVDYFVPNFGVDHDINSSLNNLNNAEKKYGRWDLPKE